MTTTHVFIVDKTTLKYHLEYLFVGTGAKDSVIDFNNVSDSSLHHSKENNLVGMIADFQRMRIGDYVIFYVQNHDYKEGKFLGIFKVNKDLPFLDNNDNGQFLINELNKSLTFRTLILPYEVYAKGVTEWEALDTIKGLSSPNQMLWSLIYRKLKASRGNTMITIYESDKLFQLIRQKNNRQILNSSSFTYDDINQQIIINPSNNQYTGRQEKINILPRLINKYQKGQQFEVHLQAYIIQNIGKNISQSLDNCLLNGFSIEWIGNEVYCGVGLQKIDVMLSLIKNNTTKIVTAVELKAVEASTDNVYQLQRYVDWLEQYYIPNRISYVQPVLISKKIVNKNSENYRTIIESFKQFNEKNNRCMPIKYIEYELEEDKLNFQEVSY